MTSCLPRLHIAIQEAQRCSVAVWWLWWAIAWEQPSARFAVSVIVSVVPLVEEPLLAVLSMIMPSMMMSYLHRHCGHTSRLDGHTPTTPMSQSPSCRTARSSSALRLRCLDILVIVTYYSF